jgi:hypothetical protein
MATITGIQATPEHLLQTAYTDLPGSDSPFSGIVGTIDGISE